MQGVWPPCKRESVSLFVPPEASALSEVVDASLGDAHGGLGIAERSLGDADGDLGDPAEYLGDSFVPETNSPFAVRLTEVDMTSFDMKRTFPMVTGCHSMQLVLTPVQSVRHLMCNSCLHVVRYLALADEVVSCYYHVVRHTS